MTNQRLQVIGFFILLGLAAIAALLMWWPFLKVVALGGILAILFLPVYNRILKHTKSEGFSAFTTMTLILLIVILPLYAVGQLLFNELVNVYNLYRNGQINLDQTTIVNHLPPQVQAVANTVLG